VVLFALQYDVWFVLPFIMRVSLSTRARSAPFCSLSVSLLIPCTPNWTYTHVERRETDCCPKRFMCAFECFCFAPRRGFRLDFCTMYDTHNVLIRSVLALDHNKAMHWCRPSGFYNKEVHTIFANVQIRTQSPLILHLSVSLPHAHSTLLLHVNDSPAWRLLTRFLNVCLSHSGGRVYCDPSGCIIFCVRDHGVISHCFDPVTGSTTDITLTLFGVFDFATW